MRQGFLVTRNVSCSGRLESHQRQAFRCTPAGSAGISRFFTNDWARPWLWFIERSTSGGSLRAMYLTQTHLGRPQSSVSPSGRSSTPPLAIQRQDLGSQGGNVLATYWREEPHVRVAENGTRANPQIRAAVASRKGVSEPPSTGGHLSGSPSGADGSRDARLSRGRQPPQGFLPMPLHVVYGESRKRAAAEMLAGELREMVDQGTVYLGYPVLATPDQRVEVDALLVSQLHGLVAFLLADNVPGSELNGAKPSPARTLSTPCSTPTFVGTRRCAPAETWLRRRIRPPCSRFLSPVILSQLMGVSVAMSPRFTGPEKPKSTARTASGQQNEPTFPRPTWGKLRRWRRVVVVRLTRHRAATGLRSRSRATARSRFERDILSARPGSSALGRPECLASSIRTSRADWRAPRTRVRRSCRDRLPARSQSPVRLQSRVRGRNPRRSAGRCQGDGDRLLPRSFAGCCKRGGTTSDELVEEGVRRLAPWCIAAAAPLIRNLRNKPEWLTVACRDKVEGIIPDELG